MTDHPVRRALVLGLLALAIGLGPSGAARAEFGLDVALEPVPDGVDAEALARKADRQLRSDRTYLEASMTIVSPRLPRPRVVAFRSWEDKKGKKSLIRILEPAKDEGTGFLKLHPNLWMYVPRVERTVRIPPSMMLQSWMGSDFSNDDLVRESSEIEDYDHRVLGVDPATTDSVDRPAYVVEYEPHEDAAVVWGRIVAWLDRETGAPLRQDFYDEEGELIRTMRFSDFHAIGERTVPYVWRMKPLDKPGHSTTIQVQKIEYDPDFESGIFTTRNLKRTD
jgi:hypothetical protein